MFINSVCVMSMFSTGHTTALPNAVEREQQEKEREKEREHREMRERERERERTNEYMRGGQ